MSVRFGAGRALLRVCNCEMYDSVTWTVFARALCSASNSSSCCSITNGTSTQGVDMFARTVRMQLKPNSVPEFTQLIEREVIPVLRKQQCFKDEITFVPSEGREAVGISLWEQKENAEAYHRGAYPEVLKAMAKVVEGTPQVQASEVSNSTWHKIAAR